MSESELRGRLPEGFHLEPTYAVNTVAKRLPGMETNTAPSKGMILPEQCGTWSCERDIATSEFPMKDIRRERPLENAGMARDGIY